MRLAALISLVAVPAAALTAEDCTRYVHTHAVEHAAQDLGAGRVMWDWTWTNEGVAHDFYVVDCATGLGIVARGQSVNMKTELPYDRRDRARDVIALAASAPHFFSYGGLADALDDVRVPSEPVALASEPCACAAFYPELRGSKAPFEEDA